MPTSPHYPFRSAKERACFVAIAETIVTAWEGLIASGAPHADQRAELVALVAAGIEAHRRADARRE